MEVKNLVIDGENLSFHQITAFSQEKLIVKVAEGVKEKVIASRERIMQKVGSGELIYGFNMGFGQHQDVPVSQEGIDQLQVNLIRTHAVSFGDNSPKEVVKMAILFRINALIKGNSGVRWEVVEKLLEILNAENFYPKVPKIGSLGASGDLSPLSHIALVLMGEGECLYKQNETWEVVPTQEVFEKEGIEPLKLEAKEGLALNNGMQFTLSCLVNILIKLEKQVMVSNVFSACMTEIMLGTKHPFIPEVQNARPYDGQGKAAEILITSLEDSLILLAHRSSEFDKNTQDPYSSRCLPQVFGPFFDILNYAKEKLEIEMNSATDNPLVFKDKVVSGGNFHGMPIALIASNIFNAFSGIVKISESLVRRIVDKDKNRIDTSCLISPNADHSISSGMMIVEYSFHAISNLLMSLNNPTFLFSASSASAQEDHVSHAPTVVLNIEKASDLFDYMLALQAVLIRQGYYVLSQSEERFKNEKRIDPQYDLTPGKAGSIIIEVVDEFFSPLTEDRYMQPEIQSVMTNLIASGKMHKSLQSLFS